MKTHDLNLKPQLEKNNPLTDESVHQIEQATDVSAPDPEKKKDPWYEDPNMNIYYDKTEDNG